MRHTGFLTFVPTFADSTTACGSQDDTLPLWWDFDVGGGTIRSYFERTIQAGHPFHAEHANAGAYYGQGSGSNIYGLAISTTSGSNKPIIGIGTDLDTALSNYLYEGTADLVCNSVNTLAKVSGSGPATVDITPSTQFIGQGCYCTGVAPYGASFCNGFYFRWPTGLLPCGCDIGGGRGFGGTHVLTLKFDGVCTLPANESVPFCIYTGAPLFITGCSSVGTSGDTENGRWELRIAPDGSSSELNFVVTITEFAGPGSIDTGWQENHWTCPKANLLHYTNSSPWKCGAANTFTYVSTTMTCVGDAPLDPIIVYPAGYFKTAGAQVSTTAYQV